MRSQTTYGIHKKYKPGQLLTICKNVFRITKNKSIFQIVASVIYFHLNKKWCDYRMCNRCMSRCYFKLIKSIRVELHQP